MFRTIVMFSIMLFSSSSFSAANALAKCETSEIQWQAGEMVLHVEKDHEPNIYFLHNVSKSVFLWLNHEKRDPSASAGWGSQLKPGKWSALMVSQPRFKLTCAQLVNNAMITISCEGILTACHIDHFDNHSGAAVNTTFWIVENATFDEIIQRLQERKIIIHSELFP